MYDQNSEPAPGGSALGVTALLLGVIAGAAALLLATKPGQRLLEQVGGQAEDWKAQAAAALAATREKVVSSVEAEAPPPPADHSQQVRRTL